MPSTEHQTLFNIILRISDKKQLESLTKEVKNFEENIGAVEEPTIRTVTASQELIRVISDAPYGMRGMANNLQELSVGFSRMADDARKAGRGTGYALGQMVKQLIRGPMAIPLATAVITTLILSMDKLRSAGDGVRVALGLLTAEQKSWNDALREGSAAFVDAFAQDLDVDQLRELHGVVSNLLEETRAELRDTFGYRGNLPDWAVGTDVWMRNFTGIDKLSEEQREVYDNMVRQREVAVALNRQLGEIEGALRIQAELQERGVDAHRSIRDEVQQLAIETGALNEEGQVAIDLVHERLRVEQQVEHQIRVIRAERDKELRDLENRKDREQLSEAEYNRQRVLLNERANQQISEQERALARHNLQIFQEHVNAQIQSLETAMEGALVGEAFGFYDALDWGTIRSLDLAKRQVTGFSRELNEQLTEMDISQEFTQRILDARIAALKEEHERRMEMGEIIGADEIAEFDSLNRHKIISEKEHLNERLELVREFHREQRQLAFDASMDMVRSASSAAQSLYRTWESSRRRDLDNLDYTEEQKREILEREGSKRFEAMKRVQIAEAVANTIGAGVSAYRAGMEGGWGPAAIVQASAMMASALATGYAQVRQIRALKIGSTGGGGSSKSFSGSFTQLNSDITARRIHNFETRQHSPSINDRTPRRDTSFNEAVAEFREVAQSLTVTMEDRTAEKANVIATKRQTRYNK